MQLDNISIIIINSNIGSRSILREVLKSFLYKVKITYAMSVPEARNLIKQGDGYDVGFIAFEFGQQLILEFINSLKEDGVENAPPFVATIKSRGDGSTSDIASLFLDGIAGFISEPYSADDILKLLGTLQSNKDKAPSAQKIKKASTLILNEVVKQIDLVADNLSRGKEKNNQQPLKSLKNTSKNLEAFYSQDAEQYTQALVETFEAVKPPKESGQIRQKKVVVKEAPHPGKVVSDLMAQRKLTAEGLKGTLKIEPADFSALLASQLSIDEEMARELSRVFGKTSKEWMKIQAAYDAYIAATRPPQDPPAKS